MYTDVTITVCKLGVANRKGIEGSHHSQLHSNGALNKQLHNNRMEMYIVIVRDSEIFEKKNLCLKNLKISF